MAKVNNQQEEQLQDNVAVKVSATEQFFNDNKKTIWGVVIAVVVIGLAVLGYSKFIYAPAAAEAQELAFPSELSFQAGEFELALDGDGVNPGFAAICDEYGKKAGSAVYLYAASCCAQLGRWEDALSYLNKYNGKDEILAARAIALKGDCNCALGEYKKAAALYEKAAAKADNLFAAAYLVKAGEVYLQLGENDKAVKAFETVKDKYPQSIEGYDIDKYINKAK